MWYPESGKSIFGLVDFTSYNAYEDKMRPRARNWPRATEGRLDNRQVPTNSFLVHGLKVYGSVRHSIRYMTGIPMV